MTFKFRIKTVRLFLFFQIVEIITQNMNPFIFLDKTYNSINKPINDGYCTVPILFLRDAYGLHIKMLADGGRNSPISAAWCVESWPSYGGTTVKKIEAFANRNAEELIRKQEART